LIVRNIPVRFNQERVLQEWPPDGTFNLLYLPCHVPSGKRPRGFAFINFLTPELALAFQEQWHGSQLSVKGRSHLDIMQFAVQGAWDILQELSRQDFKKMSRRDNLPALFYGTMRVNTEEVLRSMRRARKEAIPNLSNFSRISL